MLLDFLSHSSCLLLSILNSLNSLLIWLRFSSHNILFCLVHSTATFSFLLSSWVGRFCNSALISDWVLSISCINYILKSWANIFLCITQAVILNFFFFLLLWSHFCVSSLKSLKSLIDFMLIFGILCPRIHCQAIL